MPEENLKLKCVTGGKLLHCAEINIPIELGAEVTRAEHRLPHFDFTVGDFQLAFFIILRRVRL